MVRGENGGEHGDPKAQRDEEYGACCPGHFGELHILTVEGDIAGTGCETVDCHQRKETEQDDCRNDPPPNGVEKCLL